MSFYDENGSVSENTYISGFTLAKELRIIQTIFYRYVSMYTDNEHLRLLFSQFGLICDNRSLTGEERMEIFPHRSSIHFKPT